MKTILLAPSALLMLMSSGSCPVSRPVQQTAVPDVHDSLMMMPTSAPSGIDAQENLSTVDPSSIGDLRTQVKGIISPRCGSCHTSTLPTAKPGALEIFDLVRPDWSSTMSRRQLESFMRRLQSLETHERQIVSALVSRELAVQTQ